MLSRRKHENYKSYRKPSPGHHDLDLKVNGIKIQGRISGSTPCTYISDVSAVLGCLFHFDVLRLISTKSRKLQ